MSKLSAILLAISLAITMSILAVPTHGGAASEGSHPELLIQVNGGLLTVKATAVPHRQILEGLAGRLGFELVIEGPLNEPRSLDLQGQPWEEVLKKALYPASWAFVYAPSGEGSRLAKVVVFPPKDAKASRSSPSPAPSVADPPEPALKVERPSSPNDTSAQLETLKEELITATDGQQQLSTLQTIAALGGSNELIEALFELGSQPQAAQALQEAMEGQSHEVRQAVQSLLWILLTQPQSTANDPNIPR